MDGMAGVSGFGNFNMLQNMIQHDMIKSLSTGNLIFDSIMSFLLFSVLTNAMPFFTTISSQCKHHAMYYLSFATGKMKKTFNKLFKVNEKYIKQVTIEHITENKQINELYKAVFWYLTSNNIDYTHETPIVLSVDKTLNNYITDENVCINKKIQNYKLKEIDYKNYKFEYWFSTKNITIPSERSKERENYIITIQTSVYYHTTTDIFDDFCKNCIKEYNNYQNCKTWTQNIYTIENNSWKECVSNNKRNIDTIILKNGIKDKIKTDIELFLKSENWYNERDISYTRGYLFHGPPGTGKTSMIKGIANHCKRHIHYLMLNSITSDQELISLLKNIEYKNSILVIEDIDCMTDVVKKRPPSDTPKRIETPKPVEADNSKPSGHEQKKSQLTLSCLLNCLDGLFSAHGRIMIMTSNHPELLDDALIRPGRIDQKYLFDNCDKTQIKGIYELFFDNALDPAQINNLNFKQNEYSPAHIISVFLQHRNDPTNAICNIDTV